METNKIKNSEISKLFIYFGIIIFVISTIDLADIVFPLKLANTEWVFSVTQNVIASVLVPVLSIIILLAGLHFNNNYSTNKKIIICERITAVISFVFGLALIINLLFYTLSMKAYETKMISSVKSQQEAVLTKIEQIKNTPKIDIPENVYNKKIAEINNVSKLQIKKFKKDLLKNNIKTIIELLLYIALYFGIGKLAFDSSKVNLLKTKFIDN